MRRRACKYYRHGVCISPKLRVPSRAVTNASRCLDRFESCGLYVVEKGLEQFIEGDGKRTAIGDNGAEKVVTTSSGCEFFAVDGTAKCRVLGRALTSDVVRNCVKFWQSCPYRALAGGDGG